MPTKWKIFRLLIVINLILVLPIVLFASFDFSVPLSNMGPGIFHVVFFVVLFILIVFLVNSIYHCVKLKPVIIEKPANFSIPFSVVLLVLGIIGIILLSASFVYGFNEEFLRPSGAYRKQDHTGEYILLYMFTVIGINIYITVMQVQLI